MCSVPGGQHSGLSRWVLRVWAVALATALLLAWVSTARAVAATLKVNTTADETTSGDGLCSLREAIAAANSPGTASDCGTADSVSNTIVLGAGTYTLSIAPTGADDNTTGDLNVTGTPPLEIIGAGATATVINATGLGDRVLSVTAGATVTLQGLTVTGGHAPDGAAGADGANGAGTGGPGGPGGAGSAGADGGGILNLGALTLTDAAVTNSRAGQGGAGGDGGNGAKYGGGGPGGAGGAGGAGGGIYSSGNLTLSHVAMSNNSAGSGASGGSGGSGLFFAGAGANGGAGGGGGGIYTTGKLTLNDAAMTDNSAGQGSWGGHGGAARGLINAKAFVGGGGGTGGVGGAGGGVDNAGSAATLTVTASTISASVSGTGGNGGGGGNAPLGGCDGSCPGIGGSGGGGGGGADGGAVANLMGTVVVAHSTISSDVAGSGGNGGGGSSGSGIHGESGSGGPGGLGSSGGAIWSDGGSLSVTNSTLYSNGAGGGGEGGPGGNGGTAGSGGDGGDGGAIGVTDGASSLLNVTVDGNQAGSGASGGVDGLGGGIYVQSATSGDDMFLRNTIVAESSGGTNCAGSSSSAITDAGPDLSFPDTTCPGINGDPKLLSLKNFGGPTNTLGLAPGSAAIDQVPPTGAGCPAVDQRGVKRPQGSACDIGAFEFATPQITITTPAAASYTLGSTVLAAYGCSEGGITSPIATCKGTVANGLPIDTSSIGTKAFTVTATDKAGNQTTKTVNYTVTAKALLRVSAPLGRQRASPEILPAAARATYRTIGNLVRSASS